MDNYTYREGHVGSKTIRDLIILSVITIAILVPFTGKAFHIDDPLYIWAARHIQTSPINFYGFNVNWYGEPMPMSEIMKNPPLTSYFIAAVASVIGWGERALHIAFMLPALLLATGIYFLARRFTAMPLLAALAGIITPVFLVSATTVMSDVLMLGFWCWAVVLWMRGADEEDFLMLLLSGIFIALGALTKYFGMSLIPLLAVYSLFKGHKKGLWIPAMLLPVLILLGYQWLTFELYGRGLLSDAAAYSVDTGTVLSAGYAGRGLVGLAFAGGCIITVLFYSFFIWSRRTIVAGFLLLLLICLVLLKAKGLGKFLYVTEAGIDAGFIVQTAVFIITGAGLIALAATDFLRRRDPEALLLLLWITGTFVFASFLNWTNNGRSNLPMMPAAALLLVRGIERRYGGDALEGRLKFFLPLLPALVLSLLVVRADYSWANSARTAASLINEKYIKRGGNVWFQGHWGFQYYMEGYGAKAIDFTKSNLKPGDVAVMPTNNTNLQPMPKRFFRPVETVRMALPGWVTVMSVKYGGGFYMTDEGPLPYVIGRSDEEEYRIFLFTG